MVFNGGLRGGAPGAGRRGGQKFSQFHAVFFGNFDKIACWRPPEGCLSLLQGILDPPLSIQLKVPEWANYVFKN